MLGQGRILGRRTGGPRHLKKNTRNIRKPLANFPSMRRNKRDPYALPSMKDKDKRPSVMLTRDPMIRIMIDDPSDVRFDELRASKKAPKTNSNSNANNDGQERAKGGLLDHVWNWVVRWKRCVGRTVSPKLRRFRMPFLSKMSFRQQQQQQQQDGRPHHRASQVSQHQHHLARGRRGRVTLSCLWHAFRAFAIGIMLICIGITTAILGFLDDQREIEERLQALNQTRDELMFAPGILREDRFRLNNLSFAGPVIMGVGGFLIVASCVMTFESRDNAGKVVPTSSTISHHEDKHRWKAIKFRSSSSQTTFLDRNIVETLSTQTCHAEGSAGLHSLQASSVRSFTSVVSSHANCQSQNVLLPTHNVVKRASLYEPRGRDADVEPGLALMDEIGRQALTNAFINFTQNTSNPTSYKDSLIYDSPCVQFSSKKGVSTSSSLVVPASRIPKCPSAPNIAHHKLEPCSTLDVMTAAYNEGAKSRSGEGRRSPRSGHMQQDAEVVPVRGQYRVLTPTMYRSHMAATRQAQSMDYDGGRSDPLRRGGATLSPFHLQRMKMMQDSLELELGASATGVHKIDDKDHEEHSNRSENSMVLDLHIEGAAPVTLLVRDESRSTRSTSGNKDNTISTDDCSHSIVSPTQPTSSSGNTNADPAQEVVREEAEEAAKIKGAVPSPEVIDRKRRHSEPSADPKDPNPPKRCDSAPAVDLDDRSNKEDLVLELEPFVTPDTFPVVFSVEKDFSELLTKSTLNRGGWSNSSSTRRSQLVRQEKISLEAEKETSSVSIAKHCKDLV